MKAKEFEQHCLDGAQRRERTGEFTMSRYGVQGSYMKVPGATPERWEWRPIESLPDFEGVINSGPSVGRQFITDAKVCSAASFPCHEDKFKKRQLKHMLHRARFGAICFLLIHFKQRVLKTKTVAARTVAFPIYQEHPFWCAFDRGEVKSINHDHCDEYGVDVPWQAVGRATNPKPDLFDALLSMIELRDEVVEEKPF